MTFAKITHQETQSISRLWPEWPFVAQFLSQLVSSHKKVFPERKKHHIQPHPNFCWKKLKANKIHQGFEKENIYTHKNPLSNPHVYWVGGVLCFSFPECFFSLHWGVGVWNFHCWGSNFRFLKWSTGQWPSQACPRAWDSWHTVDGIRLGLGGPGGPKCEGMRWSNARPVVDCISKWALDGGWWNDDVGWVWRAGHCDGISFRVRKLGGS